MVICILYFTAKISQK